MIGSGVAIEMRVLVLGATGMLGNTMVRLLAQSDCISVIAAVRSAESAKLFQSELQVQFVSSVEAENPDSLADLVTRTHPDVIINCIGLVKQVADVKNVMASVPVNTLLPHRLARLANLIGGRLIHFSTDCVFSGEKGNYIETDRVDATDVYGMSKSLGEVSGDHAVTLRTSIIGHEIRGRLGLLEWFLAQRGTVKGFTRAVFSGFPTVELARIVRDYVLPRPDLTGLYHVSAEPIAKYNLLNLIATEYGKSITIVPDDELVIDRSLNSDRFRVATGYKPPSWPELIASMHGFR
jgi:dTDP-4-dehydrorhamnose reductase